MITIVFCYSIVISIFCLCYSIVYLDESYLHDLKWTVEIIYYRGLTAVAEDSDPTQSGDVLTDDGIIERP
jgi:hypothetical protein